MSFNTHEKLFLQGAIPIPMKNLPPGPHEKFVKPNASSSIHPNIPSAHNPPSHAAGERN